MKRDIGISLLLFFLASNEVECRTWRSPPSLLAAPTNNAALTFVRGGSAETPNIVTVPSVPKPTAKISNDSNLQQNGIVRGGSTRTRSPSSRSKIQDQQTSSVKEPSSPRVVSGNSTVAAAKVTASKPAPVTGKNQKNHKHIAKKLKNRNATNLRRKVLHASFGFLFAGLNHFIPKAKFVPGMVVLTTGTLLMELLRYRKGFGWMNDTLHFVLGSSLRKHEMDGKFTGSFYYFLGVTLTAWLNPKACATLGICQLAVADPTASYFGRATRHVYWSRIENGFGGLGRNKGILGFLGGGLACVPMNYYLLSIAQFGQTVPSSSLWFASFALGFAGAFADLAVPTPALTLPKRICGIRVPPFHVDDNVVVPIVSGYACQRIFEAVKWSSDLALAKYLIL